jgi:hypothetical protein
VIRLEPEIIVPNTLSIYSRCYVCYTSKTKAALKCCSACKVVSYCSIACTEADLLMHQKECKALISLQKKGAGKPSDPGEWTRMVARLFWKREQRGKDWWDANIGTLEGPDFQNKDNTYMTKFLCGSVTEPGMSQQEKLSKLGIAGKKEIEHVDNIVQRNANKLIISTHTKEWGLVLSSKAAMFNHSCEPNVAIVFPKGPGVKDCLHIVAVKDIKAGEELTISYIDSKLPYVLR